MEKLEPTPYFSEFKRYYKKAQILQDLGNIGGKPYQNIDFVEDDLMQSVTIYDTVERKYAGFSNMLQDLWWGTETPKYFKLNEDQQRFCRFMNTQQGYWGVEEWAYLFLIHRLTGSGASFEEDHGYRNTIIPQVAFGKTVEEMSNIIYNMFTNEGAPKAFTSIGNQIPAFPKTTHPILGQGIYYIIYHAAELAKDLSKFATSGAPNTKSIRSLVDYMCEWNKSRGFRQFKFPFSAVAADFADYFPILVDRSSEFYHGKNAVEALGYMFKPLVKMKTDEFLDEALDIASKAVGGYQYDVEDVCCDSIRWIENYIPLGKKQTYAHLCLDSVWNSSLIKTHPKGRQKLMLEAGIVDTFKGKKNFSDYAILESTGLCLEGYSSTLYDQDLGKDCLLNNVRKS